MKPLKSFLAYLRSSLRCHEDPFGMIDPQFGLRGKCTSITIGVSSSPHWSSQRSLSQVIKMTLPPPAQTFLWRRKLGSSVIHPSGPDCEVCCSCPHAWPLESEALLGERRHGNKSFPLLPWGPALPANPAWSLDFLGPCSGKAAGPPLRRPPWGSTPATMF